ncbi:MAG: TatD family hydrolase [Acidimicrobiia bacterium]|nr:TatD family hydrolase [Acidimicrobiia bacterium]
MVSWVDSHCHLHMASEPPEVLLDRAKAANVDLVVCPGTDADSSRRAIDIAAAHPDRVVAAAGLHPHDSAKWSAEVDAIHEAAKTADAVGECGLDYYRDLSPRDAQRVAFRAQLELAADLGKPVIVHCRDAFADVYEDLANIELGDRVVLHCWTGGPKWTKRFRELGVVFSFAGPVTFPNGGTVRLGAEQAPPERTMVETDTPYLTPPPHRGLENEPRFVPLVGVALGEVWGIDVDEVAALTTATARKVFGR